MQHKNAYYDRVSQFAIFNMKVFKKFCFNNLKLFLVSIK